MFGMDVKVQFGAVYGYAKVILHNVTEVHYRYPRINGKQSNSVAFESNIHQTGIIHNLDDVIEFEVTPSEKVYNEFEEEV